MSERKEPEFVLREHWKSESAEQRRENLQILLARLRDVERTAEREK